VLRRALIVAIVVAAATAATAAAALAPTAQADPRLDVPAGGLRASLQCPRHFLHRRHNPVLLVHGTGLNADESWDWNYELALPPSGYDWCAVTLPDRALGDIQVSSEYVVYGIERGSTRSPTASSRSSPTARAAWRGAGPCGGGPRRGRRRPT
jgi:hypothetical protein